MSAAFHFATAPSELVVTLLFVSAEVELAERIPKDVAPEDEAVVFGCCCCKVTVAAVFCAAVTVISVCADTEDTDKDAKTTAADKE